MCDFFLGGWSFLACIFEGRGNSRDFGSLIPTNRYSLGSTGIKISTRVTWGRVRIFFGRREFLCRSGGVLF